MLHIDSPPSFPWIYARLSRLPKYLRLLALHKAVNDGLEIGAVFRDGALSPGWHPANAYRGSRTFLILPSKGKVSARETGAGALMRRSDRGRRED